MPQGAIVLIRGDVYLATGANQWLGSLQAEEDLPNSDQVHYPRSLVLSFAMNDAQLTELTRIASDADLELRIDFRASMVGVADGVWPIATSQETFRPKRQEWIDAAEQLGALASISFSVPGRPVSREACVFALDASSSRHAGSWPTGSSSRPWSVRAKRWTSWIRSRRWPRLPDRAIRRKDHSNNGSLQSDGR